MLRWVVLKAMGVGKASIEKWMNNVNNGKIPKKWHLEDFKIRVTEKVDLDYRISF